MAAHQETPNYARAAAGCLAAACLCGCGPVSPFDRSESLSEEIQECAGSTVEGIDIYDGTGSVTWSSVKAAGIEFAIIKATQGTYNSQSTFPSYWSGAKGAGLLRSAYHFFDPTEDGVAQAQHFLSVIGSLAADDLPAMLDIECPDGSSNCLGTGASGAAPATTIHQRMWDWINTVAKATGKAPLIYTYGSYFSSDGIDTTGLAAYPLNIADVTTASCFNVPSPWQKAAIWQYSWTGMVSGIGAQVDRDRFLGNLSDLQAFARGGAAAGHNESADAMASTPADAHAESGYVEAGGARGTDGSGGSDTGHGASSASADAQADIAATTRSAADADTDATSTAGQVKRQIQSDGCGCRVEGSRSYGEMEVALAISLLAGIARRRRTVSCRSRAQRLCALMPRAAVSALMLLGCGSNDSQGNLGNNGSPGNGGLGSDGSGSAGDGADQGSGGRVDATGARDTGDAGAVQDSAMSNPGAGDGHGGGGAPSDGPASDGPSSDALASDGSGATDGGNGHTIKTVFLILMENHDWSTIKGSASAPYINNTLLPAAAHAEQYYNPPGIHPSLPNYLWLEAGQNFGILDDSDPSTNHQATTMHLVTQMKGAGVTWRAYEEDIPGTNCPLTNAGNYAVRHDPFVYFDDVTMGASASCTQNVRPYTQLATDLAANSVAQYNFITPNVCDDMHDDKSINSTCASTDSIKDGDTWLSTEVPKIQVSSAYTNGGAIFITWDEGEGDDGPIGMIVVSPVGKGSGYSNTISYTHSSTLRTMQAIFTLSPLLGDAANATDLRDLFSTFP